ncbi:Armadillo-like helical [Corchorus olitorius]|uniref:Armadillo-like helical n=1 Tax=Corchorus olitorius TaxID=93759 RepID=A0A1R3GB72_9ROSI|nr:Armadillo-like helical [Corchorus olitorius]
MAVGWLLRGMRFGSKWMKKDVVASVSNLVESGAKFIIGDASEVAPLLELFQVDDSSTRKHAAYAKMNLSSVNGNTKKFVEAGAIKIMLQKISELEHDALAQEPLEILALFSTESKKPLLS